MFETRSPQFEAMKIRIPIFASQETKSQGKTPNSNFWHNIQKMSLYKLYFREQLLQLVYKKRLRFRALH